MKIWKYPLDISQKVNALEIPGYGKFLDVQVQNNIPVAWFIVDEGKPIVERLFTFIPTGADCNISHQNMQYLKTIQLGEFVFHCFEYITSNHVNW